MDINQKILKLCNERGWSIYNLSLETGITQSTLNSMFQRGNPPKIETLQCICIAFGITLSQFFLEEEQTELLTSKEQRLISLFRALPENKQNALLNLIGR